MKTSPSLPTLEVKEGQRVLKGNVLAVFETTKSASELTAEEDGFILGLRYRVGDTIRAGERLCYLAETPASPLPFEISSSVIATIPGDEKLPQGLRITQPALVLASDLKIDLELLPKGILVTEKYLLEWTGEAKTEIDPGQIVIYGGGGHAKSLIDLIRAEGKYQVTAILDDGILPGTQILGIPVLGGGELLAGFRKKGIGKAVNAVGGIGNIQPRLAVYQKLADSGFTIVTVTHPRAYVESTAWVGDGCQVFFNAYIGSEAKVGFGNIVNTGAIISHDCTLGEYVNISPGAILAGAVTVGDRVLIGMGVTINLGVKIGAGARIGNSAVVKADVPENGIVRAGAVWPVDDFKKQ